MFCDAYDIGPIRPPSEANSLLVRVNRNCPWNRCEFCHVYKGTRFEKKSVEEIKGDIDRAAAFYGKEAKNIRTCFLQDANAVLMKTPALIEAIGYIREKFQSIERITAYGRAQTLARKSLAELTQLREAGLNRLHLGMESGSARILEHIDKGTKPEEIITAGRRVREAGMSLSLYYMPGLGGRDLWEENAVESANVCNAVDPDFIRLRTLRVIPGTPLGEKLNKGLFTPLTDIESVVEIRLFIEKLEGITSRVVSDHLLNLLGGIEGELPGEKEKMLSIADRLLSLPEEEKAIFQVGSRLGWMRNPEDLGDVFGRERAIAALEEIRAEIKSRGGDMTVEDFIREAMSGII